MAVAAMLLSPRSPTKRLHQAGRLVVALLVAPAASLQVPLWGTNERQNEAAPSPAAEWPGSCPAACCNYGAPWTATTETAAFAEPRLGDASETRPAFTIPAGAVVRAVTGTLYSLERGRARVDEDFSTDATYADLSERRKQMVTLRAGDTLELLAPRGGSTYRVVHGDAVIDANLHRFGTEDACRRSPCAGVILKLPVVGWWVMVMDAGGRVGWVENRRQFSGAGACR